jgi:tellurite resistance protein
MALSVQTQWTLVASGLIAHADEVMAGEECERLMTMLDERADADEYTAWFELVSDPDKLFAKLETLPALPEAHHREVLEEAWLMAAADGKRLPEEAEMLGRVARKLGVESVQLDFWRDAWTATQNAMCEVATAATVACLVGGRSATAADREAAQRVWELLPVTEDQHAALQRVLTASHTHDDAARQLQALGRPQRKATLRAVATVIAEAGDDEAQGRLRTLGEASGLDSDAVSAALEGG